MEITETKNEGLKRAYKIIVPAADIELRMASRLGEIARTARMPGFRPGKVPVHLLRKTHGNAVMGEVLEQTVSESSQSAISENDLRPVAQPKIEIDKFEDGEDLEYTIELEIFPEITLTDFSSLKLERLKVSANEEKIDADVNGTYPGRQQEVFPGSWVQISDSKTLDLVRGLTLQAWIYPTMPHKKGEQGLISKWSDVEKAGYGMCVGEAGDLEVWLGNGEIGVERVVSGKELIPHQWYFVAATFDPDSESICLYQIPVIGRGASYHQGLSSHASELYPNKLDESFRTVPEYVSGQVVDDNPHAVQATSCLLYTSPSPRD